MRRTRPRCRGTSNIKGVQMVTDSTSVTAPPRVHVLRAMLLWALLAVTGCAQIPVAELTQYRDAFNQSRQVSEEVLLDFDQVTRLASPFIATQTRTQGTGP